MRVIEARNVNDAFSQGVSLIKSEGLLQRSRAGDVLVVPYPVITHYHRPTERVLFDYIRDANPFFHIFEAIWMLSGRRDATWLDRFVKTFSSRFAEDNGEQHGAYGFRWRRHFDIEGGGNPFLPDQLDTVVNMLKKDPLDRRAVITMWDPVADLGAEKKDIPCNLVVLPRIRFEGSGSLLDITVFCRSNDIIWGAYGANAVHFSVLQEYLAARLGVEIGSYYQISNNYHAYVDTLKAYSNDPDPYQKYLVRPEPIFTDAAHADEDIKCFVDWVDVVVVGDIPISGWNYYNRWFRDTGEVLIEAHTYWKGGKRKLAENCLMESAASLDWKVATLAWMKRRLKS